MNTATTPRTPGQFIQEQLDARGWTKRVLAVILQTDETGLNKIIAGKRPLDAETALALSAIFDVPAGQLLELQKNYELAQASIVIREDPDRNNRVHIFGNLPIPEMIKRGWLAVDDVRNFSKVESELARFFGVPSVEEIEMVFPHAAKKTAVTGSATTIQLAWLYRVKEIAKEMLVCRYSPTAVREAILKLKPLLASPDAARKVPRILAECGIRYVIVESLTGAKIDGVCFWLGEVAPVIGMSLRYDRIDNFWFVLRHELEHVIQGHGRNAVMLDVELEGDRAGVGDGIAEEERIANQAAAEFCVPQRQLQSFIARKAPVYADRDIVGFARTLQIHPGLVAGQLRHKLNRYDRFTTHLVKIRSTIAPSASVDGWGDVAPVGM